jgi:hypothetical protein
VHADPDEVLLRRFQALLAYMDMTTWRHFRIDEGQLRLAHNAEPWWFRTSSIVHLLLRLP